jgi:hypothetical protein
MAGPGNNPVQVFATGLPLHWEFLRLWTGFELPSSWNVVPCYVLGPVPGVDVMAKRPQGLLNVGTLSARMAVLRSCALDI